jgi:hypothetical protein
LINEVIHTWEEYLIISLSEAESPNMQKWLTKNVVNVQNKGIAITLILTVDIWLLLRGLLKLLGAL